MPKHVVLMPATKPSLADTYAAPTFGEALEAYAPDPGARLACYVVFCASNPGAARRIPWNDAEEARFMGYFNPGTVAERLMAERCYLAS